MDMEKLSSYQCIVGYGIGQYYDFMKSQIPVDFSLDYLCDAKWEQIGAEYDHIKVISPQVLAQLDNPFVIIFSGNKRNYNSIVSTLEKMKLPYKHAEEIFRVSSHVSGKQLKEQASGVYCDARGNRIEYYDDIEDSVNIHFQGGNNVLKIGKNVSIEHLDIFCGRDAKISIGNGTEVEEMRIFATDGKEEIGKDCLISYQVTIRNHDTHHIFDRDTGERINYPGNITIGNHVWVGYGATLLGNMAIEITVW